jgi:succinoglycan biosynthesis protein ExoM
LDWSGEDQVLSSFFLSTDLISSLVVVPAAPNLMNQQIDKAVTFSTVIGARPSNPGKPFIKTQHIAVCVCTYKRPHFLRRLLDELSAQETGGLFTYSIVIADNDELRSAEPLVAEVAALSAIAIRYCVEPQQNIALARNKAIENADGDFVAFIDDDEFPEKDWLKRLFQTCDQYQVDGVLGPVKRHFDEQAPAWLVKSRFYDRHINPTGSVVEWEEARTGNVLLRKSLFESDVMPFRKEFRAGEDQDFFRRKIEQGRRFVWSADAIAYETVPPARWKRSYLLRKALLRGATAALQPTCGPKNIIKSMIAVPIYVMALPFALLSGQHRFMTLLVKIFDHLGKLLALVGLNPVKEQYVVG